MQAYRSVNGSSTAKGNYLWGGALTLAWKQLSKSIIKEPIAIKSDNKNATEIAQIFNQSIFDASMLSENCYYAKAGFGNQTVKIINQQVSNKFPSQTTPKLKESLPSDGIVSYAYFLKKMKFRVPFFKSEVLFKGKEVAGFQATNIGQKRQVFAHSYIDSQNFIIELKTKSENDHIFVIKSKNKLTPGQAISKIQQLKQKGKSIRTQDKFQMPKVSISHERNIEQLRNIFLKNEKFKKYFFSQIYEIIKLDIDETGVKVENLGIIACKKTKAAPKVWQPPRKFILDKPFWVVMREKQHHPYFLAYIEQLIDQ